MEKQTSSEIATFTLFSLTEGRPPGQRPSLSHAAFRKKNGGERGVEYTLNVTKLFWSRFPGSGVVVWCLLGCALGFVFFVVFCTLPGKLLHPISFQFQTNFQ